MEIEKGSNPSCDAGCPVKAASKIIDHKWMTLIIRDLISGKKRYSELSRSLEGISPKVLAERLRFLSERGLVIRTVYPTVPPTTDYELTSLGRQLEGIIQEMYKFGLVLQEETE